ncbi:MAG: hypothetical protein ABIY51_11720 [Ferruginibacter sp.]
MKNRSSVTNILEVSIHNPLLLQARISRIAQEADLKVNTGTINGWEIASTITPMCMIEGNMFLGNSGLQMRIPYRTSFIFTWIKSNKKGKLAWSMSLS